MKVEKKYVYTGNGLSGTDSLRLDIEGRFDLVIAALNESQEPKALEETLYKCGGFCLGPHGPECKVAKPQDEPKECSFGHGTYTGTCKKCKKMTQVPHQESETGTANGITNGSFISKDAADFRAENIVLPRPRGMSIGESLYHFLEESPTVWFVSDDDFMTAWKVFLKSLEK